MTDDGHGVLRSGEKFIKSENTGSKERKKIGNDVNDGMLKCE